MAQKLSPYKASRMLELYFRGYTQTQIANKLSVDQSTVSLYVSKFKYFVEQYGIKAAGEEFNIMDTIEALHSLAAELKKSKITAEEAKAGAKIQQLFQKLGIKEEDYKDLVQSSSKMKVEGFLASAVKLNKLENSTGMTCEDIVDEFDKTHQDLLEDQHELQVTTGKLTTAKDELADINKQKKLASQTLETHMNKIAVDMKRLRLIENLALTLKEAGVSNKELEDYTQRQQLVNKADISLDIFVAILREAKVLTSHDQGKGLLKMLSEYGGLTAAIEALQTKIQSLGKQVDGLEQKAKLKGEIEGNIIKLTAQKDSLETCVAQLSAEKNTLAQIQNQVSSLTEKKTILEQGIADMEEYRDLLGSDIESKEQKVSDLKELELKHDAVSASLSEIQAKEATEGIRWEIFESLLGFIGSSSLEEVGQFADLIPYLLSEAKQGKYSPEELRSRILRGLTGETLQSLLCVSCNARFVVDKPPHSYKGYDCPICGLSHRVKVDQEGLAILKTALATQKPQIVLVQSVTQKLKNPAPKDKNSD